jgi:hypothetical protein
MIFIADPIRKPKSHLERTPKCHVLPALKYSLHSAGCKKQARGLLVGVQREIRSKEADLLRLKKEESHLSAIAGQRVTEETKSASGGSAGAAARINWGTVLEQLPKQFTALQIRTVRGLKNKRSSEIFAAITRWMEAGAVKRKKRGLYERVQQKT